MHLLILAAITGMATFTGARASAFETGGIFVDPHVAVGYNVAQGSFYLLGADVGFALSDQLAVGVGGFYAAGKRPTHDREFGYGPFVSYVQPLTPFLFATVREDIDYIDQHNPVQLSDGTYTHVTETGTASITTVGVHVTLGGVVGLSGGYRAVLALNNSDLGKDRSGVFVGFSVGI